MDDRTISAIQCGGNRMEYHPPDMGLAYSHLAPLVTEAYAFMTCGDRDKCDESLKRAREVIKLAGLWSVTATVAEPDEVSSNVEPDGYVPPDPTR